MNTFMQNLPRDRYFQSLPVWLQENILQSGIQFGTEHDLQDFVAQYLSNQH
ncbi:MAG: hypothetical protein ACOX6P_06220 [Candidatus Merdivicinus sp.]|jgi:hypothetical protein